MRHTTHTHTHTHRKLEKHCSETVLMKMKFVFSILLQVFVEYANAGDSKAAQKLLTGRMFDGKFVVATFYPLSAYKRGYLYQTLL